MKKLMALILAVTMLALTPFAMADAGTETSFNEDVESPYTEFDGLNISGELTGDSIEMTLVYQEDNGENFAEYFVNDMVVVSYERHLPTSGTDAALDVVRAMAEEQGVTADDLTINDAPDVSAQLTYPAYRIEYTTGENEDKCKAVDIYVETQDWAYIFHTLTPIDSFDDYSALIDEWIGTLHLEEISGPASYDADAVNAYPHFEMPLSGDQVELIDAEQYSDIEYDEYYAYDGGQVVFAYERYQPCEDGEDAVKAFVADLHSDELTDLNVSQDDDLTASLSYPTYRAEYTTGANEDTTQNVDIIALLDNCMLNFHVETNADMYSDYQQLIEGWIATLEIVDAAESVG